jgi:hypothetical protein
MQDFEHLTAKVARVKEEIAGNNEAIEEIENGVAKGVAAVDCWTMRQILCTTATSRTKMLESLVAMEVVSAADQKMLARKKYHERKKSKDAPFNIPPLNSSPSHTTSTYSPFTPSSGVQPNMTPNPFATPPRNTSPRAPLSVSPFESLNLQSNTRSAQLSNPFK